MRNRYAIAAALTLATTCASAQLTSTGAGKVARGGSGNSIAFTTLAGGVVGGASIAGSGTYAGTAPTSLTSAVWGGGCAGAVTPTGFTASGLVWSASFPPPAGGGSGCTVTITDNLTNTATSPGVTITPGSQWSLVASAQLVPLTPTGGTTVAMDTTGANLIVIIESSFNVANPSDNKGNTYILRTENTGSCSTQIYYIASPSVGAGHTFTIGDGSTNIYGAMSVMAFKDTSAAATPFTWHQAAYTNVTTASPGSITPNVNDSLIVSGACNSFPAAGPQGAFAVDSGFTIPATTSGVPATTQTSAVYTNNVGEAAGYLVQATVAAVNPTWSWTNTASSAGAAIVAFSP